MLSRVIDKRTQVRIATWGCGVVVSGGVSIVAVLAPTLLVPFLGLVTLPALLASVAVLLYAIPSLAYLLLAQTDAPRHAGLLFLPLNPVRNVGIITAIFRYLLFCADTIPGLVWSMGRYLVWERMLLKAGEVNMGSSAVGDLWDGFAIFGLRCTPQLKLDIYLPPHSPSPRPRAPDIDGSDTGYPPSSPPTHIGKPVIVFIYDVGMIGPFRLRRWTFALLGARLAEMGYVVVIPDIGWYPPGDARSMVEDLRRCLSWVKDNISDYNGDPSQIHIIAHGLGAHQSLYTISQQTILTSLRKRDARRARLLTRQSLRTHSDDGDFSYFSPEAPMSVGSPTPTKWGKGKGRAVLPGTGVSRSSYAYTPRARRGVEMFEGNGEEGALREMGIYGEEIEIPKIQGVILLAPVTDVIKQIKHESASYLEHISTLRRTLGPTQEMCMRHSLGHLLFAGKGVLDAKRMPRVMIIHGAQDSITPLDHAHWLHELLHGLDVNTVFRPYRNMTHWGGVLGLMLGSKGEYTDWLENDVRTFIQTPGS